MKLVASPFSSHLCSRCKGIIPIEVSHREATVRGKMFYYCTDCVGIFLSRYYSVSVENPTAEEMVAKKKYDDELWSKWYPLSPRQTEENMLV